VILSFIDDHKQKYETPRTALGTTITMLRPNEGGKVRRRGQMAEASTHEREEMLDSPSHLSARRHDMAARRTSPVLDGVISAPKSHLFADGNAKQKDAVTAQVTSTTEPATFRGRSIRGSQPGGSSLLTEGMTVPICLQELRESSLVPGESSVVQRLCQAPNCVFTGWSGQFEL
jgi:hypothetical protein